MHLHEEEHDLPRDVAADTVDVHVPAPGYPVNITCATSLASRQANDWHVVVASITTSCEHE